MDPTVVIALITASPGIIALLLAWRKARSERQKVEADATKVIVDSAAGVVTMKDEVIADLRIRIEILEREAVASREDRARLHEQIGAMLQQLRVGRDYALELQARIMTLGGQVPEVPEIILTKNLPLEKGG